MPSCAGHFKPTGSRLGIIDLAKLKPVSGLSFNVQMDYTKLVSMQTHNGACHRMISYNDNIAASVQ